MELLFYFKFGMLQILISPAKSLAGYPFSLKAGYCKSGYFITLK